LRAVLVSNTKPGSLLFDALKTFKPYIDAKSISIYLAMPTGEIQTDAIVRDALAAGKRVFVPYLHGSPIQSVDTPARVMDMVNLKNLDDYESLQRDRWGIPSIDPSTVHERQRILGGPDVHRSDLSSLDLILMPGVAFDIDQATGAVRRIGHGKGFYDFFIDRYSAKFDLIGAKDSRPVLLYGLALTQQFLSFASGGTIPVSSQDQPLHGLILGNGEIKLSENSPIAT
jgi:5-formyltetrahydrofolate cyclo-ligase